MLYYKIRISTTANKQRKKQSEMSQVNQSQVNQSQVNQSLSVFLPFVFCNISKKFIKRVFEAYEYGVVDRVDLITKRDQRGRKYHCAYVHFSYWFESDLVEHFQERIMDQKKEARVVYDDPWYWIVLENYGTKNKQKQELADDTSTDSALWDAIYSEYYETQVLDEKVKVEELSRQIVKMDQVAAKTAEIQEARIRDLEQALITELRCSRDLGILCESYKDLLKKEEAWSESQCEAIKELQIELMRAVCPEYDNER